MKTSEYRELATMLQTWIREKTVVMTDRSFPATLIEMKKQATESTRFRTEDVPMKQREKTRLQQVFRELQVLARIQPNCKWGCHGLSISLEKYYFFVKPLRTLMKDTFN